MGTEELLEEPGVEEEALLEERVEEEELLTAHFALQALAIGSSICSSHMSSPSRPFSSMHVIWLLGGFS